MKVVKLNPNAQPAKDPRPVSTGENPFDVEAFEIRALAVGVIAVCVILAAIVAAAIYFAS